jgi:hypothetical protein
MDSLLLDVLPAMLYFFLWIAWLLLLFRIILDIFRSRVARRLGQGRVAHPDHPRSVARPSDLPHRTT